MPLDSQLGRTVNNFGLLGGDRLSMAQGALQQTGNPLDLAIEGEGFFQIQTANGIRYTRDGGFHRAQSGQLVTAAGEPVLSATGQPILVPPGEVTVGADGALSVAGGVVATVGVFTFPAGARTDARGRQPLRRAGGSCAGACKECRGPPGSYRGRQPGRDSRIAGPDRDAAPGGDDAEGADRLPHRVQQDRHRGFAQGVNGSDRRMPKGAKMIRALYTAASGMSAQQMNLDTIANNLANSSTTGSASCAWSFRTWSTRTW